MVAHSSIRESGQLGAKRLKINRDKPEELLANGLIEEVLSDALDVEDATESVSLLPGLFKKLTTCVAARHDGFVDLTRSLLLERPDRTANLRNQVLHAMTSGHKPTSMRGLEVLQAAISLSRALLTRIDGTMARALVWPLVEHAVAAPRSSKRDMLLLSQLLGLIPLDDIPASLLDDCLNAIGECEVPAYHGRILVQLLEMEDYLRRTQDFPSASTHDQVIAHILASVCVRPTSQNTLTMLSRHVLPQIMQQHPAVASLLLLIISSANLPSTSASVCPTSSIYAWIDVASVATSLSILRPTELPPDMLRLAIHHADYNVRITAFKCLTASLASADRVEDEVWSWVREWFASNLDVHSAEFRSTFGSSLARFCTRIQLTWNAASRASRAKATGKPQDPLAILAAQEYLRSIQSFLNWLLENAVDSAIRLPLTSNHARMLIALDILEKVVDIATPESPSQSMVSPFTPQRVERLLACLGSNFTEIRDRAMRILLAGPTPLPGWQDPALVEALVHDAHASLLGARNTQAEAGKLLIKLVFTKQSGAKGSFDGGENFVQQLLDRLEKHVEATEKDLAIGLQEFPLHGLLSASAGVVSCLNLANADIASRYSPLLHRLFSLIRRVWAACSPVLTLSDDGTADHEIARVYDMLDADDNDEGSHLVVLSSCWRAMKEAAALLSVMVSAGIIKSRDGRMHLHVWHTDDIVAAGQLFRVWLSSIRHRGAFSSIAPSFEVFVRAVRPSTAGPDGNAKVVVEDLCREWLEADLEALRVATASTTRRSAAIPFSILALVHGDKASFLQAFASLIEVAENVEASYTPLVQTHALNVLKVVILDGRQAPYFQFVAERATTVALQSIASEHWNVKNAALMLFAGLTSRMIGKHVNITHGALRHSASFKDWIAQYPLLASQLLIQLRAAAVDSQRRTSIFPALALIRHWEANEVETPSDMQQELLLATEVFLGDREWKIREIAAQTASALVTPPDRLQYAAEALRSASQSDSGNVAHGLLLQVKALLERLRWDSPRVDTSFVEALQSVFNTVHAAGRSVELAVYFDIVRLSASMWDLPNVVTEKAKRFASEAVRDASAHALGGDLLADSATRYLVEVLPGPPSSQGFSAPALRTLLREANRSDHVSPKDLWTVALRSDVDNDVRLTACRLLLVKGAQSVDAPSGAAQALLKVLEEGYCVPLAEAALALLPIACDDQTLSNRLRDISNHIVKAIHDEKSEESRMAGLQCLSRLYARLFDAPLAIRLGIDSSLWTLLSDDDEDVRRGATDVICDALAEGKPLCHDRAVKIYWDHLCHFFAGTPEWYTWLWSRVCNSEIIDKHLAAISGVDQVLFATEPPNLYRQDYDDVARAAEVLRVQRRDPVKAEQAQAQLTVIREALQRRLSRRLSPIDSEGDSVRILELIAEQLASLA